MGNATTGLVGSGRVSDLVSRVLAPNPGPMELDGTNTYVIRHPRSKRVVVVDPGPDDDGHLRAVIAHGEVELILLTHHHPDHSDAAERLSTMTRAPVRAIDPGFCVDADTLHDGEEIAAGGTRIVVVATPGHTVDSVCFLLPEDQPREPRGIAESAGSVLTGDTILGRGTTVIAHPDGSVGDYLGSMDRLRQFGPAMVLPGHGPVLDDLAGVAAQQHAVRSEMLIVIQDVVARFSTSSPPREVTVRAVTEAVYSTLPVHLRFAADMSVAAQLAHLGVPVRSRVLAFDDDARARPSPVVDAEKARVAPVTSRNTLGEWLDHPEGAALLRELLTQIGIEEKMLVPLSRFSLDKLVTLSKGMITQELVDDLVYRAGHP